MNMVRNEYKKLNIFLKQDHLLDIYSNNTKYLELGTISIDAILRLLKYEMVQLDDIAFLPIQNTGFSQSHVKNESLKSKIPYFYFQNINKKSPYQVFITHGMIKYKNETKQEVFAPLILFPVNIFYENGRVYFQLISEPIENAVLIDYLQKEKGINIPIVDHLDNIFNIDRFISNFEKQFPFSLENFLTYARPQNPEFVLDLNKFNLNRNYPDYLYENLFGEDGLVYYSKKYNRNQRYALRQALEEQSFVITGRLGTGKTTVLRDIAINAILDDKKVLYVSNQKETLDSVYNFFKSKDMHYYVTNFANSFASFHSDEQVIEFEKQQTQEINLKQLEANYEYIKNYQQAMSGRILDHRFIDVVNELILLDSEEKQILEIDNLDDVYKFEYLEILKAVKNIQNNLGEIEDFKNCVWKEIPIINDIKYPNQVISLIHKVYSGFIELEKHKEILEKEFGFREVGNYAYLKNILHNFRNLNINEIPKSWLDQSNYEKAKVEYHKLKTIIYTLQELEYDLDIRFDNLDEFNIQEEIKTLYGNFFTNSDLDTINKIIEDRLNIIVKVNKVFVQIDIFNKAYGKLKKLLNYDFPLDNNILEEINKFGEVLNETNINHKMIKTIINGKFKEVQMAAWKTLSNYLQYNTELENLFKNLPLISFGSLDETVRVFDNYSKGLNIKRGERRIIDKLVLEDEEGYKAIIDAVARYYDLKLLIKEADEKFIELLDYHPDKVYIDDLQRLFDYVESIKDLKLKSRIIKFLKKFDSYSKNIYKFFNYFYKSHERINSLYDELISYGFLEIKTEFKDKLNDLKLINNYVQKLFNSSDNLYSLKKINRNEYVTAEDYYYIYESVKRIADLKHDLKLNNEFSFLFGNFYQRENTDLSKLSKVIQAFKLYTECFKTEDAVVKSLGKERYLEISNVLGECTRVVDDLNEVFKLYFKIFKNSVSRFYYSEFSDNTKYLTTLLNNKESLIIYLRITDSLQVLAKHQLYKFIEYIVYLDDASTLTSDFKYTYFTMIKDMYLEKYPFLEKYKAFEANLKIAVDLEDEIIRILEEAAFQKIRKKSGTRINVFGVRNLDYNNYIRRTSNIKHLFLTNTQVLNTYLNIKDFDLVLVDDAQLFSANEYAYALQGKQVIVAGELQLQEAVANNLISRISLSKNIVFNHRYSIMPKSLKNYTVGLTAPTYKNYYDNFGVEVITKDIFIYIASLFKVNPDYKINIFTSSLTKQRQAYDEIASLLLAHEFDVKKIINILTKQINITDLKQAYLVNANFNFVYLEDYYYIDEDYLVVNMVDNLALVENKLVIYDNNNYLEYPNKSNFLIEIEKVVDNKAVFEKEEFPKLVRKLVDIFSEHKIQCFASELSTFTIRVKSNIYGITIYWDSTKTNYDILNEFRDIHSLQASNMKKIIVIWAMELLEDFDGVVQRVLKEVYND